MTCVIVERIVARHTVNRTRVDNALRETVTGAFDEEKCTSKQYSIYKALNTRDRPFFGSQFDTLQRYDDCMKTKNEGAPNASEGQLGEFIRFQSGSSYRCQMRSRREPS